MASALRQSCSWTDAFIPAHLVCGFMGAGKTTWIKEQFQQGIWGRNEKVLYLLCETSEEKPFLGDSSDIILREIECLEDFCRRDLMDLTEELQPDRIIVESNGMWQQSYVQLAFPANWKLVETTVLVCAETFDIYVRNMGSLMMEKLRFATRILFNRCTEDSAKALRKRNLHLINQTSDITLSMQNGRTEPYDNGEVKDYSKDSGAMILSLDEFGFWIVHFQREPEAYVGRTVEFDAYLSASEVSYYQLGRSAMVCCAQDIVFLGVYAVGEILPQIAPFTWIHVRGTIRKSQYPLPDGTCYYLAVEDAAPAEIPPDSTIYF